MDLRDEFGDIDIYLFDQLQKGRVQRGMKVLDAGCGYGRNLRYFLKNGFDVYGVDGSREAISTLRATASELAAKTLDDHFHAAPVDAMPFADGTFDFAICNAVLHFAADEAHFERMVLELWRVVKRGGIFFARLASDIGIESRVQLLSGRRFHLPDGSDRFLVNEAMLLKWGARLGAEQLEPIKTVNVQGLRCMTTWVLRKP